MAAIVLLHCICMPNIAPLWLDLGRIADEVAPAVVISSNFTRDSDLFVPDSRRAWLRLAVAVLIGGSAYAIGFTALGTVTTRALIVGLGYTLIWEGVLAGLLEGTKFLSIRQATLGIAAALTGRDVGVDPLSVATSVVILAVVIVGGIAVTASSLRRFQVRAAD